MKRKAVHILLAALIVTSGMAINGCSNTRNIKVDTPLDSVAVRNLVYSQNFVFIPRYVNPMTGRRRDLTPGFDLSISKDSLISYLPFFGRGYRAPLSPTDVDFDFTSTKFTYIVTPRGNGWNISVRTKDQTYLSELFFRIYPEGSASLNITSADRSAISYDGYITKRKSAEEQNK